MMAITVDAEQLRRLDEDTRQAWSSYSDRLREVSAEEYELVEIASWDQLQLDLRRVEQRRHALEQSARR